jgi:hypothetical protein
MMTIPLQNSLLTSKSKDDPHGHYQAGLRHSTPDGDTPISRAELVIQPVTWSIPNDEVRDQSGLKAISEDPRRKANLLRSFHARLLDDRKSDKSNGFKQGDAPKEVLVQNKQGVWALVGSRVIVNKHGVAFRNDELEIWDGGRRVNIWFASQISEDNPEQDPNFAFVSAIIDSLTFNVTEGSPLNDLPAPREASVDSKAMRF